jgi:hypothetical protein
MEWRDNNNNNSKRNGSCDGLGKGVVALSGIDVVTAWAVGIMIHTTPVWAALLPMHLQHPSRLELCLVLLLQHMPSQHSSRICASIVAQAVTAPIPSEFVFSIVSPFIAVTTYVPEVSRHPCLSPHSAHPCCYCCFAIHCRHSIQHHRYDSSLCGHR